jgi:hypothetical protein
MGEFKNTLRDARPVPNPVTAILNRLRSRVQCMAGVLTMNIVEANFTPVRGVQE